MPPKTTIKKRVYKSRKSRKSMAAKVQAVVKRVLNKNIETKTGLYSSSDGTEIAHNNFITLSASPLATINGTQDAESTTGQRIGDKINLKGVSIRFMTELNERYSDVSFRFLFVRCAKGDTPTRATLFNSISGNKMLDTLNRERYTIIKDKWFKIRAPNTGTNGAVTATGSGLNNVWNYETLSRATKIVKVWIPGYKIAKGGVLQYEDASTQLKFYDYHCLLYAYSNYSTNQDLWNVGRLNDIVIQMYYKDG